MSSRLAPAVLTLLHASFFLYCAGYARVRASHGLVRYESGCIGQPDLHPDFRAYRWTCSDFHVAEGTGGRSAWQVLFRPLIAAEEVLRKPAD